ncbi:MAG: hypothetical protein RIC57_08005 [Balneola sp.]
MGFFKNDKKGKPPHTWYPDILHWREDDSIYCWNVMSALGNNKQSWAEIHRYTPEGGGFAKAHFTFVGVNSEGKIFVKDEKENLLEFEFYRFIKKSKNESLANRMVQDRLKGTENYMELMKNFQRSYDELQEADENPKRMTKSKTETE